MPKKIIFANDSSDCEKLIKEAKGLTVLVFTTISNSICEGLMKKLEFQAKTKLRSFKVGYIQIDMDDCQDFCYEMDIKSVPGFLFMKKGKEICRFDGEDIDDALNNLEKELKKHYK